MEFFLQKSEFRIGLGHLRFLGIYLLRNFWGSLFGSVVDTPGTFQTSNFDPWDFYNQWKLVMGGLCWFSLGEFHLENASCSSVWCGKVVKIPFQRCHA